MSGFTNGNQRDLQKPFPGCMGRMINIFDLSAGMAGTMLLTDKAHRDGSPVRRYHSEVVKGAIGPIGVHAVNKLGTGDLRRTPSKKSGGTPMKMLIAQEMSKETELKANTPNIVARLMGLEEDLQLHPQILTSRRSSYESYPRSKSVGSLRGRRLQEDVDSFDRTRSREIHSCSHEREYRDSYEAWQQLSRTNRFKDQPVPNEARNENQTEKRMALVRQKFLEAKRLATDEKLLHSKEFQEALEVLSSNRDLFIKFLEEPSYLSKHLQESNTIQTKHITVLKPSKTFETKGEKHVKTQQYPVASGNEWDHPKVENIPQSTRIVVLKPSTTKPHDINAMSTTPFSSPELPQQNNFYRGLVTFEAKESESSHHRDDSLLSSVLSNGYVGDDSSFGKSENECIEDVGNLSDSDITTASSRHSWDYINRFGSPYSISSFSRASNSPESSVLREAKKRLSERRAIIVSNGIDQQQTESQTGSNTLGDMLAIPVVHYEDKSRSCVEGEELISKLACLSIDRVKNGADVGENSPRSLSRSKSVPVSSSAYENIGLNIEASESQVLKTIVPKEVLKSKSGKLSLKGKVTNFFSRNKKSGKQKHISSPLSGIVGKFQSGSASDISKNFDDPLESLRGISPLVNSELGPNKASSPTSKIGGLEKCTFPSKASISLELPRKTENLGRNQNKLISSKNSSDNQDQPSPISVLDASFEDDAHNSPPSETVNVGHPKALSRSAPIWSVARSLSWNETNLPSSDPSKLSRSDEAQEQHIFVENLLISAGLGNEKVGMIFKKWHSLDSPLNPMLVVEFLAPREERANNSVRRSSQRLLFDLVNAALLDIGQTAIQESYPWARPRGNARNIAAPGTLISSEVWGLVRGWLSDEVESENSDNSEVVNRLLKVDIGGGVWTGSMLIEVDEICKQIGGDVLEELVGEALECYFTSE